VFLEQVKGSNKTSCLIHNVKPMACLEWTPSLYRRECQEGLVKYWSLTVSPSGQLEGSEEKLRDFNSFLETPRFSGDPDGVEQRINNGGGRYAGS
jgi:Fe-S-cluster containining protein